MNAQGLAPLGPNHDSIDGIGCKSFLRHRASLSFLLIAFLAGCGGGGGGGGEGGGGSGNGGDPTSNLESSTLIATVNLSTSMESNLAGDAEVVSWIRVIVDTDGDAMAIWSVVHVEGGLVTSDAAWASYYDHSTGTWGSGQKIAESSSGISEPQAIFDEDGDLFVFGRGDDWWWNKFSPSTGWEGQETFPDDLDLTPLAVTALREVIVRDESIISNLSRYDTDTGVLFDDVLNAGVTGGPDNASASRPNGELVMAVEQSGIVHARIRQYSPASGWESEMQTPEHLIEGSVVFSIDSVTMNADRRIAVIGTAVLNPLNLSLSSDMVLAAYYDGSQWLPWQVLDEGIASVLSSSVRMDTQGRVIALWDSPGSSIVGRQLFASSYNPDIGWSAPEQISSGSNFFNFNAGNDLGVDDVFTMDADGNALVTWSSSGSIWKNQFNPSTGSWEGESPLIEDSSLHPGAPRFLAISATKVNASGNGFLVVERRVTDIDDPFVITSEIRAIPVAIP